MRITEYDLRGLFEKEITPEVVTKVVQQFLNFVKNKKVLLALDANPRSLMIKDFLETRFKNKFKFLGALPTPIFYYFVIKRKNPGIMITASHLPQRYVGLKFLLEDGSPWKPIINSFLTQHQQKTEKFPRIKKENLKKLIVPQLYEKYFEKLKNLLQPKKTLKVNFDLNNFFLRTSLPYFRKLKILHSNKSKIKIKGDLDNDRIFIFLNKRKILPDLIFFLIALSKNYQKLGVPIYFSKYLESHLKNLGKKIFYLPTGHYYFKKAYKKYQLDFAFEPSGHFYLFKDLKTEAPYLALGLFLQNFDEKKIKDFSQKFILIRKNQALTEKLEKLIKSMKNKFHLKLKKFDGYLLYKKNLYLHLRQSKTEPSKLRISLEIIKNGSTGRNYEKNF